MTEKSRFIATLHLGKVNAYLVSTGEGYALIDAGPKRSMPRFLNYLSTLGIEPQEVRLIVVTHVHDDHVGGLSAIRGVCDCPVMVHAEETDILRAGTAVIPPGSTPLGRIASAVGQRFSSLLHYEPVDPDVLVGGTRTLEEFGVDATVVPTPGHSAGSVSVVVGDVAFVGDLMMNVMPFGSGKVFPLFADDVPLLFESWETLIDMGAGAFYPGHGRPITAKTVQQYLKARRKSATG